MTFVLTRHVSHHPLMEYYCPTFVRKYLLLMFSGAILRFPTTTTSGEVRGNITMTMDGMEYSCSHRGIIDIYLLQTPRRLRPSSASDCRSLTEHPLPSSGSLYTLQEVCVELLSSPLLCSPLQLCLHGH